MNISFNNCTASDIADLWCGNKSILKIIAKGMTGEIVEKYYENIPKNQLKIIKKVWDVIKKKEEPCNWPALTNPRHNLHFLNIYQNELTAYEMNFFDSFIPESTDSCIIRIEEIKLFEYVKETKF